MKRSTFHNINDFSDKGLLWCDYFLIACTGVALLALTAVIFIDVALRYLIDCPIPAGKEISELLMPYIAFCALSYTLYTGKHIRITVLSHILGTRADRIVSIFNCIIGALFCGMITIWSWKFFWTSYSVNEEMLAVIKLPWYVGKFAMPLGYLFFTLRYLFRIKTYIVLMITDNKSGRES